jgi:hypothetical protein
MQVMSFSGMWTEQDSYSEFAGNLSIADSSSEKAINKCCAL